MNINLKTEKVIGVLGGMGPYATAEIFKRVLEATPAKKDWDHLRIIIDNNPKIPSRTRAVLFNETSPVPMMIETAKNLERAGADFIIIPCNSAHNFYKEIQKSVSIPILNIVEETKKRILSEIPNIKKIGLLAGEAVIKGNLYGKIFEKDNIQIINVNEEQEKLVRFIIEEIKIHKNVQETKTRISDLIKILTEKQAEAVILGCTEFSIIHKEKMAVPIFDTNLILAEAAVSFAKGI